MITYKQNANTITFSHTDSMHLHIRKHKTVMKPLNQLNVDSESHWHLKCSSTILPPAQLGKYTADSLAPNSGYCITGYHRRL